MCSYILLYQIGYLMAIFYNPLYSVHNHLYNNLNILVVLLYLCICYKMLVNIITHIITVQIDPLLIEYDYNL